MVEDPEQIVPGKPLPYSTAQGGHAFTSASRSADIRSDSLTVGEVKRMRGADLKKRFRWDEFLSEKIITVVAFVLSCGDCSDFRLCFSRSDADLPGPVNRRGGCRLRQKHRKPMAMSR